MTPLLKTFQLSPITFRRKFTFLRFYQALLNSLPSSPLLFFTPPCLPLAKTQERPSVPQRCGDTSFSQTFYLSSILIATIYWMFCHVPVTVLNTVSSAIMWYLHGKKKITLLCKIMQWKPLWKKWSWDTTLENFIDDTFKKIENQWKCSILWCVLDSGKYIKTTINMALCL